MDRMILYHVLLPIVLVGMYEVYVTLGLETSFKAEEKVDFRRELDKMVQEIINDPFYHSYVFSSGIGNRENLEVEWMKQEVQFTAGQGVVKWQAVRNMDQIYLLGQELSSVTLVSAAAQLSSNRSVQFGQHSTNFEANVTSTSMFTRWNPATSEPEVIAVVAIDTFATDILFYRIINGTLEHIAQWSRYRKFSCLTAVRVDGKNQLIVVNTGSPASIDVFDVHFTSDSGKLDFKLEQSFEVVGECLSMTVCRAGGQHYLVLPLTQNLVVYKLVSGHYQKYTELPIPHVSQVVSFNVALETYLAVNGKSANVLRLTEGGEFVSELMPGYVSEWLALPVSSYRSDVLLLSRDTNVVKAYVWGGTNRGFDAVKIPPCDACLEGDWSGATSVPFRHHNCLLIPQSQRPSNLVIVGTRLSKNNPTLDKLRATLEDMQKYQAEFQQIQSKMAELEEALQHVVKRNEPNVITGQWKIERLESPAVRLNSFVQPQSETNTSGVEEGEREAGPMQLETVETAAQGVLVQGNNLIKAVEQREKQVWGLDGFKGKVNFKGKLYVDNLTVTHLNNGLMDEILHNTFRKDKPETIQQIVVIEKLEAEDIDVERINNFPSDSFKFADGPVVIRGNVTLESPLTVKGEVELKDEGKVNGVDLSEELCPGEELCSVFPMVDPDEAIVEDALNYNTDKIPTTSSSDQVWSRTIAGRNLTVKKINGVDWRLLTRYAVYKDVYQNITGSVVVGGKVTSESVLLAGSLQHLHKSQDRASDSDLILQAAPSAKRPASADLKFQIVDDLSSASQVIVSELEVIGTVSSEESEWGEEAADVVLRDTNPIVIQGHKTFSGPVNVTNNAQVEGTVGGVNLSDLLTTDTDQVFYGPTTLHGDITLEDVTLTGLWNGKNVSDVVRDNRKSYKDMSGREVTAESLNVLKTLNGVPVSDFVFTGIDDAIKVKTVNVETLNVAGDIVVKSVNEMDLKEFNEKRFSLQKEQNISGKVLIKKAKASGFQVEKLNDVEVSLLTDFSDESETDSQTLHLSELHIEGDITTDEGVNGFNLTDLADNVVWLEANNEIEGPLVFKDEVEFDLVECQGFCNNKMCDSWLGVDDVIYKNNKSITLKGKKRFLNFLTISEDLTIPEINGHKMTDVLTKTTDQEIAGDLSISGDVRVAEDATILGLLNGQDMGEFGHRCTLSENTIICKGNTVFKDNVVAKNFHSSGKINEVNFDSFLKSVIRTDEPQQITGFKKFNGDTTVENIEDLDVMNGQSWDDFIKESVSTDHSSEDVNHPVTFTETLILEDLSVDYHLETDTVNGVNLTEWRTNAIYINEPHTLEREMILASATSHGNLSVEHFYNLNLEIDIVKLHSDSHLPKLTVKSVTVLDDVEVTGTVNNQDIEKVEKNTLKMSGDQMVKSDLGVMGETVVGGSLHTRASVNRHYLKDVVTLDSDQTLHGKYEFDCVEAQGDVSTPEMVSGINLASWNQTGVNKGGNQEVSGVWRVQGPLELQGPVIGKGRLASMDLKQLTDTITRDILDVHRQMKNNLTEACEEANAHITTARNQSCDLQYLDVTQTLLVPAGPSLATHFKSDDEDFLAISEKSCTTIIYKWNKNTGTFTSLHREMFGFSLKNFIVLNHGRFIYVVTESSDLVTDCEYRGKHLWVFVEEHFKHISQVNFFDGDMFQGEKNALFVINSKGMFKYELDLTQERVYFKSADHRWNISTDVPREWLGAVQYDWLPEVFTASNCSGLVISVSVDPGRQFVAIASVEYAQVPRHADYIKVYRKDGQLFDKLPAQNVKQLQWLSVPNQTWLVTLQNHATLNLYKLQEPNLGFQQQLSAALDVTNITAVALPLSSKVNPQPFIILQSPSSVKILRAFLQGDPYLGDDLICSFDDVLTRVPRS